MTVLKRVFVCLWLACCTGWVLAGELVTERGWVEDPAGDMTLAQVMVAPQTPMKGIYFGRGFSNSAFWIRLRIDPSQWPEASPDKELVIRLRPAYLDEFQLYDPMAPKGEVRYTGDRQPWTGDDYQSLNNNFVVPLGPAPRDVWLRLKTTSSTLASVEVSDLKTARVQDARQLFGALVYLSVLLICMGWGLLSWLNSRDQLVRLYVFREFFMIAYVLVILGLWRVLGSELVVPEKVDEIGNLAIFMLGFVAIWFDIHFLRQFKPKLVWIKILYGHLFAIFTVLMLRVAGYVEWSLRAYTFVIVLAGMSFLLMAISTSVWSDVAQKQKPVVSKTVLVVYYLLVVFINVLHRLIAMDVLPSRFDAWNMLLLYPLGGSLMMMAILQLRAQQQRQMQRDAEWRIALAERSVQEEKNKRQEQQQFLAMLGHELRNPLSAVNFLADGNTREGQQIRRAVQDMSLVLERSVQVERLEEDGFQTQIEVVDLPVLLQELSRRAPPPRLQLHTHGLPQHFPTDRLLLSIVLGNLLDNALKYSPEASVVTLHAMQLGQGESAAVRFRVTNAVGPAGVPDTDQLFKKYYRNPAAHHQVGSGLGLYLVRGLLKILGGRIDPAPSIAGQAQQVVFEVTLPMKFSPEV
jgi:two-component system, sensor histidine kinase LadS